MVAFYPHFVSCGEKATLKDVVGELNDSNSIISLEFYCFTLLSLRAMCTVASSLLQSNSHSSARE